MGEPVGGGRPGWHIECSAMVEKHLPARRATSTGAGTISLPPPRERARPELRGTSGSTPSSGPGRTTGWSTLSGTRWQRPSATWWTPRRQRSSTAPTPSGCGSARALLPTARLLWGDTGGETPLLRASHEAVPSDLRLDRSLPTIRQTRCRAHGEVRRGDGDDLNTPRPSPRSSTSPGRRGRRSPPVPRLLGSSLAIRGSPGSSAIFGFDLAEELAADVDGVRVRYPKSPGTGFCAGRRQGTRAAREGLARRRPAAGRVGQRRAGRSKIPPRPLLTAGSPCRSLSTVSAP